MENMDNHILIILLLFGSTEVLGQLQLEPLKATALQGSDVPFNATVKGDWEIMTWIVKELLVLTINANTGDIPSSPQFCARNLSSGDASLWEFRIRNVSRNDSGPISCTVMGTLGTKIAQLSVQESGTVNILSGSVTVHQDEQAEFQCATSNWFPEPMISWFLNGMAVNSSLYNTTAQMQGDYYSATSVLRIQAVRNTTVECRASILALANPLSDSVNLVVVPKPADWTVLIAVVVSIGGFALLVLLILGIIFCCKWKKAKESSYQDEMSKARTDVGDVADERRLGKVNLGYVMDGQTSVAPSECSDSDFIQTNGSNSYQMPPSVYQNQTGENVSNAFNMDGCGFRRHRHVTIV